MTGFFLLYAVLIIVATELTFPAAVMLPAVYSLYARQLHLRWALILACSPLFLALVPSFTMGAFLYCVLLVSAMAMHLFLMRGSLGLAVGGPAVLIFAFVMGSILAVAQENGFSVQEVIARWADTVVSESLRASSGMLSGLELREFQDMLSLLKGRIVKLFPSIVLTGSAILLWLNLLVISTRQKGMSLREWKSPDWLIGGFIIAGVLTVLPMDRLSDLGLNLLVIVGQIYFFQGLAIVSVFMGERGWPLLIRWPLYFFILIQIYMMVIVAGIGLFDAWFDFRKRIRTPKGDRE
jgi:hypothetical protein